MRGRPVIVALASTVAILGCGSSADKGEPVERASITADVRAPSKTEITDADFRRVKQATASRAFLEFWSDLQYQDWVSALARYTPGLRRVVGSSRMLAALRRQASFYRTVKPDIEKEVIRGRLTTVRFAYGNTTSARTLASTIWRKVDGRWVLVFDGLLDSALDSWAQTRTQLMTAPDAAKPTKEALRAGIEASELQARYLPFLGLKTRPPRRGATTSPQDSRSGESEGGGAAGTSTNPG